MNSISQAFHGHLPEPTKRPSMSERRPAEPHPVPLQLLGGVYFRHDLDELKGIDTRAARLGAERFVLEHGLGSAAAMTTRRAGRTPGSSTEAKFPDGLALLIDHVLSEGMRFGLWFEPEMVNRESDLFRAHPDYMLGPQDQPSGRNQHVLDMAREDVRRICLPQISAILSAHCHRLWSNGGSTYFGR